MYILQVKKQRLIGTKSNYLNYILPGSKPFYLDIIASPKFMYPPEFRLSPSFTLQKQHLQV